MTATVTERAAAADRAALPGRLAALERLTQTGRQRSGPGGFDDELLAAADDVLARSGQRLALSAGHAVVALAGGTGSGKSSLFNQLSGADFSATGVTRPMTSEAHACTWGAADCAPMLDWLGVPPRHRYARDSALGAGEASLAGLVLIDLPDHDSVMGHATELVDRLVRQSDLVVWVLDPQKYADMAVHDRFFLPLAGHSEVVAVVLNQCDLLTPAQVKDCLEDLRRLLDDEGLPDVQILCTSAVTGEGTDELRGLLARAVSAREAACARVAADLDNLVDRFAPYAAQDLAGPEPEVLGPGAQDELAAAFARAAGADAIGDSLRSARELRAADYTGWPFAWLAERITSPDPVRKVRLGKLWEEMRGLTAGPAGAAQAEVDNALASVAATALPELPAPWSATVAGALRSRAADVPAAASAQVGAALPAEAAVERWWRVAGAAQGLLLGCALAGTAWFVTLLVFVAGGAGPRVPALFATPWLLAVAAAMAAAGATGGWLTGRLCGKAVSRAAGEEAQLLARDVRQRMASVARTLVLEPAQQELAALGEFRAQLAAAAGVGRAAD